MARDRVWQCKSNLHAQPCWHGKCGRCDWATAFDFTEDDVRDMLATHQREVHGDQAFAFDTTSQAPEGQ